MPPHDLNASDSGDAASSTQSARNSSEKPAADQQPTAHVAVIGAGPAGLMAAEALAAEGVRVTVYDRMASPGRKFLIAGRGGLNLTHSEQSEVFLTRYGAAAPRLAGAITAFSPAKLRAWCAGLGQETFVGSSGRVFPAAFKASPLLRAWLRRLAEAGVAFVPRHHWLGFAADGSLRFDTPNGPLNVTADAYVLALGGASWPQLGADGAWTEAMHRIGVATRSLRPANCGFLVRWSDVFRQRCEGQPLKGIALRFGDSAVRGEAVITRTGIEGGGIYALSALLREALIDSGAARLEIALRADLTPTEIEAKLAAPRGKSSLATHLRKVLKLSPAAIALLQEASRAEGRNLAAMTPAELAQFMAAVPLRLEGVAAIDRAISTAGGVRLDEIDDTYMLRRRPGTFVAGEMLDWEAPTGGYLLQACFATGAAAGRGAALWLDARGLMRRKDHRTAQA